MYQHIQRLSALGLAAVITLSTVAAGGAAGAINEAVPADAENSDEVLVQSDEQAEARTGTPTYQQVYNAMIALETTYPEGMTWTNFTPYGRDGNLGDTYWFKGGKVKGASGGVGCAAFVFLLSDEAFGDLPARTLDNGAFTFEDVKVGDILRVDNSHFVIVLQKSVGGVIIAEANYNKSVHWGRAMSVAEVEAANFLVTRYPENYVDPSEGDTDEVIQSGTENGLNWTLTMGGTLTITGSGAIPDYDPNSDNAESQSPSWSAYNDSISAITIESGVTKIGAYAFYQSKALSIIIPNTVTSIGSSAFRESGLVAVTIPSSVQAIGDDAFRKCTNMTSVSVTNGLKTIGERAFHSCTSLQYIDFPASITSVGGGAFAECGSIISIRFAPGTSGVSMGDNPFTNCKSLMYVTLPEKLSSISNGMFSGCNMLQYLCIPAGVERIYELGEAGGSPFLGSGIIRIDFGGTEAEWDNKGGKQAILQTTGGSANITVNFNVPFNNPFAADPDDPGDLVLDSDGSEHQHVWSADWSSNSTHHWHACTAANCPITADSQKSGYAAHSFGDWATDAEATASQAGSRHRDCTVCGYRQTESIPATGSSSSSGSSGSSGSSSGQKPGSSSIATVIDPETGAKTETTNKSDGSTVEVMTQKDGTITMTTTDASGKAEIEIQLSGQAVQSAEQSGQPISLPVGALPAAQDIAEAPAITIRAEEGGSLLAAIPVVSPSAGTVAVVVRADGSTDIVKTSVPTGDSIVVPLENGTVVKIVDNSKYFSDVPAGAWMEDAVAFVSARELFSGTAATDFSPDSPMTRAMLMTVLARLDGADTSSGEAWYTKGVEWAVARGISDGSSPNSSITREQLITMLWRYLGSPAVDSSLPGYVDAGQVSGYAQDAMRWAVENGIIHGFGNGRLEPQTQATRAQVAQIMKNLIETMTLPS